MNKRDYYEILGVDRSASTDEIKRSYRKLALKYHPDRNQGDPASAEKFKEASEAYEILSDAGSRSRYDRFGHDGVRNAFGAGGFTWDQFTHGSDLEDILGSFFSSFFGGGGRSRADVRHRGRDLRIRYQLTLEEVLNGKSAEIQLTRLELCDECKGSGCRQGTEPQTCPQCNGMGQVRYSQGFLQINTTCERCGGEGKIIADPCVQCNGKGRVNRRCQVKFEIPKGVETGMTLRVTDEGEAGLRGGPRGDLHVSFEVEPHERFRREGADLICDETITFSQAALGDRINVQLLDGEEELDLPAGTQSHAMFHIRGRGLPTAPGEERRGDAHIRVMLRTPKKLNDNQAELFRKLAEEDGHQPKGEKGLLDKVKDFFDGN
ncbi:molecular chaperone DnaJ [Candidatus Sumerlaeota bacterium]|nr:molecular chaperone DnaJ [Candidatus Sumerlaeota bacterium]